MSVATTSLTAVRSATRTLDYLLERPRTVLGALVGAQIAATLVLALRVEHNGWIYFQGGDQIWFTTTGWLLGRLQLAPTEASYMWPLVQAPITWLTGSTYVQLLPVLVVERVRSRADRTPLRVRHRQPHRRETARLLGRRDPLGDRAVCDDSPLSSATTRSEPAKFLPQATGCGDGRLPIHVVVLAPHSSSHARSLPIGSRRRSRLILLGAAGGLKPPNLLLGFGAVLAYPLARRWREGVAFGGALAVGLLMLAFWKQRTLGTIPAFSLEQVRLAAGATPAAFDVNVDKYVRLDLHHWRIQMAQLREFFFSPRLAQWAPLAGLAAVIRVRRGAIAGLLAGWLGAFILVKGFNENADIQANTFWRLVMPAWPAYLLLFASIPLLVPTLFRRLEPFDPSGRSLGAGTWVAVAFALTILVPAAATAASARIAPPTPAIVPATRSGEILTPVDTSVALRARQAGRTLRLSWSDGPWRTKVFYRVFRSTNPDGDLACPERDARIHWSQDFPTPCGRARSLASAAIRAEAAVAAAGQGS